MPRRAVRTATFVASVTEMSERGATRVVPELRPDADAGMELPPWVDPEFFNPGYLMRGEHQLPNRTRRASLIDLNDGCLRFSS